MILINAKRLCLLVLITGFGFMPAMAAACSCASGLLEGRYERSQNVFSAVITGGKTTNEGAGIRSKLETTFEVTEIFKGTIPFDHFRSRADGSACGISLQVGVEYLVFAPDSGNIGLCSGIVAVSGIPKEDQQMGQKYVAALRSFTSGANEALSEPWFFIEYQGICRLSTGFPYGEAGSPANFSVVYRTRSPDNAVPNAEQPQFQPGFSELIIRVPGRDDLADFPLSLGLGDNNYTSVWEKDEYSRGRYVLHGDAVLKLVADLESASALHLRSGHPEYGDINAKASMSNAGVGVTRMLSCIEGR